jgi:hypothetical protein
MTGETMSNHRSDPAVVELELATTAGPGWLGGAGAPLTVSFTAESVRFDGEDLQFLAGPDLVLVRTVPRADVAALTWRGSPPRGRPQQGAPRNAGASWADPERERLRAEVLGGLSWTEIGRRHERSVAAVRAEAVKLRLVDELGRLIGES